MSKLICMCKISGPLAAALTFGIRLSLFHIFMIQESYLNEEGVLGPECVY